MALKHGYEAIFMKWDKDSLKESMICKCIGINNLRKYNAWVALMITFNNLKSHLIMALAQSPAIFI